MSTQGKPKQDQGTSVLDFFVCLFVSWIWPIKQNLSKAALISDRYSWWVNAQCSYHYTEVIVSLSCESALIHISFCKEKEAFRSSWIGEDGRRMRWWLCFQSFSQKSFCRCILLEHIRSDTQAVVVKVIQSWSSLMTQIYPASLKNCSYSAKIWGTVLNIAFTLTAI